MSDQETKRPRIVIIGGGFGGLTAAKALEDAPANVTLIDRTNHHLFQPLLYQVATCGLSPAEIAAPIRSILRGQTNAEVLLAEVERIDLATKTVHLVDGRLTYDFLVLAAGAHTNYFGHPEWEKYATGLKSLEDALAIRTRVLRAFEMAERETDPVRQQELLTFVVIGGGPTGVELAGAFAELSRYVLASDFRHIDPRNTKVILLEAGDSILPSFGEELSKAGRAQLEELGVVVRPSSRVTLIDEHGVELGAERIVAATVVWGAGVRATPLAASLGVELDRGGRVMVEADLSLPGHPNVFAIGDMALYVQDGEPLPGLSPVAMQEARAVAKNIEATLAKQPRPPFRYVDKGSMATIGRSRAIAKAGSMKLKGFIAWLAWLFVHVFYLIGFRNRFVVMFNWAWSYVTFQRGARLINASEARGEMPALSVRSPQVLPVPGAPLTGSKGDSAEARA